MNRRSSDPTGRRLRNFVLLVIFTVAAPSLVLTGFGIIAINNERAAALKRVNKFYAPILDKLVDKLRFHLESLEESGDKPLEGLVAYARRESAKPGESFAAFVAQNPNTVSFFVFDREGKLLLPRQEPFLPSWQGYLPAGFDPARAAEFTGRDPAQAARGYQEVLARVSGSDPARCVVLNALGRSQRKAGLLAEALATFGDLAEGCADFVDPSGYNLAVGARPQRLELARALAPATLAQEAQRLGEQLSDLRLRAGSDQVQFAAATALGWLGEPRGLEARIAAERLTAITLQGAMLAEARKVVREMDARPKLRGIWVGKQRQLLLLRGGEYPAGLLLLPRALNQQVKGFLRELGVDDHVTADLMATLMRNEGDENSEDTLAASAFLIRTDLAWHVDLVLTGKDSLDELTRSRTTMYLWVLVLIVGALVLGIGRTVIVMIQETRLSRLKTDFVSRVSHELRTPLTSIRMFTETLLLGRVHGPEEQRECLVTIGQETERLSRLVERILDFSRMEAGRRAYRFLPEAVGAIADEAIAACRPMIEAGAFQVVNRVPADLPRPEVDRDALAEVLINLLSNALKYSPQGRPVEIWARGHDTRVEIGVTDQGFGIARSEQKKIFEKFYRAELPTGVEVSGSGLGLSLVQYIVRAHGGEIRVESTPGQGSTFTIDLPLKQAKRDEKSNNGSRNHT